MNSGIWLLFYYDFASSDKMKLLMLEVNNTDISLQSTSWCGIFNTAGEQSAVRGDALEAGKKASERFGQGSGCTQWSKEG